MSSWQVFWGHSNHHDPKMWPKGPSLQEQLRRTPTGNFQCCSDGCMHQLWQVSQCLGLRPCNPPNVLMASLGRWFQPSWPKKVAKRPITTGAVAWNFRIDSHSQPQLCALKSTLKHPITSYSPKIRWCSNQTSWWFIRSWSGCVQQWCF